LCEHFGLLELLRSRSTGVVIKALGGGADDLNAVGGAAVIPRGQISADLGQTLRKLCGIIATAVVGH
jgi:hypothetical protein